MVNPESNNAYMAMLQAAKERLRKRMESDQPEGIARLAGVEYKKEKSEFLAQSFGKELHISYPDWSMTPEVGQWHHVTMLHYLDLANGVPVSGTLCTMGELKDGMVRGGGFDRDCEQWIQRELKAIEPEKFRQMCVDLGADIVPSNADFCAVFHFAAHYPVTLKVWFADEEFPASGRILLDTSADHYLTIEDAVTVGGMLLDYLGEKIRQI